MNVIENCEKSIITLVSLNCRNNIYEKIFRKTINEISMVEMVR